MFGLLSWSIIVLSVRQRDGRCTNAATVVSPRGLRLCQDVAGAWAHELGAVVGVSAGGGAEAPLQRAPAAGRPAGEAPAAAP